MAMIFGYIIMVFITNKFGASGYGEYTLAVTILSVTMVFSKFGFDTSIVRIIGEIKFFSNAKGVFQVLKKTFFFTFTIGFLLSFFFFIFSSKIAVNIFHNPNLTNEFQLVGWIVIPASLLYLIAAYFQAYKRVVLYMFFNSFLLNAILMILLFVFEFLEQDYTPFLLYSLSVLFTFLIGIILLGKSLYSIKNINSHFETHSLSQILKLSLPMLLSNSFVLLMTWSDIIMLSILSDEKSVGIYNASQRIAEISNISLFAINAIATPKFVEYFSKNDIVGLKHTVLKSTKLIFYSSLPLLIFFMCFAKTILNINGAEFVLGATALIFLCLGKFFNSISGSVGYILQMTNNHEIFKNVMLFSAVLNILLNFILIPKYGFNGAAFASMITVIVWNSILVYIIKKKMGFWTVYNPFPNRK